MGLSDVERIDGIYWSIHKITEIGRKLDQSLSLAIDECEYSQLVALIQRLWHGFLGKKTNALHWIIGSSATNPVTWESVSPWSVAIKMSIGSVLKNEQGGKNHSGFTPFDGNLDIASLLGSVSKVYSYTYEIYAWSEQLSYFLRRYDDEFLKEYSDLSELLSSIYGKCFSIFCNEESYARAYLLNRICELIYDSCYYEPKKWEGTDVVCKFLYRQSYHEILARAMRDKHPNISELVSILINLLKCRNDAKKFILARLVSAIKVGCKNYCDENKHKELINMIEGVLNDKEVEQIKDLLKECRMINQDRVREREFGKSVDLEKFLLEFLYKEHSDEKDI